MKALLGTKIGMTQIISESGVAIPVTLIQAGPVTVTQLKSVETDGYSAVQVAFGEGKNISKAVAGHVKASATTPKHIREFRVTDLPDGLLWETLLMSVHLHLAISLMLLAPAKVKDLPETSNVTTSIPAGLLTVVMETFVNLDQLYLCTHKRYLRVSEWLVAWATTK